MTKRISSMFSLNGKVAVVTGASRGIGKEMATVFARAGARVVLNSRKEEGVNEAAAEIKAEGGDVIAVAANVSSAADRIKLVESSMDWAGRIDILANNAGTNPAFGPLADVAESAWDKIFEVNLKGPFFLSQMAYKAWMKDHGGSIINTASVGGYSTAPYSMNVYNTTKAALIHLTKCLSSEWRAQNVRVNAISPGVIKTRLSQLLWDNPEGLENKDGLIGTVADIAGLALLLASDAGAFINGESIIIDGGAMVK